MAEKRASEKAEAIREVLLAQGFKPSKVPGGYDGTRSLHKQFFLDLSLNEGPLISQYADNSWQMNVRFAWEPQRQRNDPDMGQFEIADAVEELESALAANAVLGTDDLTIGQGQPEWRPRDEDGDVRVGFWDCHLRLTFMAPRRM